MNSNEITIRGLEIGDAAALYEIEQKCFSLPWSEKDFADLLTREYCTYFVALLDGRIAGFCGFTNLCNEADIDHVFVDPDCRGRGIAKQLLERTIEAGLAAGVEAFTLEVRVSNAAAIHIYEKAGFVSEGIRPRFYEKPVEDAMIMWRR